MRLKYQLFLTLLLSSVLLIALMAAFNSWSFSRGFANFLIANEKQRLAPVIDELELAYDREQSWGWIQNDPQQLRALMRNGRRVSGGQGQRNQKRGPDRARPPPILLADENKALLVAPDRKFGNVLWEPISSDSSVVGYLGFPEPRGLPGNLANVFAQQQQRSYLYAAIVMILLSVLLASALAARIVKPILKVNDAVGHITAGEYQHRITTTARDEIGDLSRNINQMGLTLEKNLNARQQWTAEISHELRTPIAVLQGELEAIQDGVNKLDEPAIASLHAEVLRLSRLIDDLHELSLSDLGALNYHMEKIDIAALVQNRLRDSKSLLMPTKLKLSTTGSDTPRYIQGDEQRLTQLIDNLLQNSLRYTNDGGSIDVQLGAAGSKVILEWADSLPGVADDQLPKLFKSLYRAEESRSREMGGSGLGLALVAKIAEAHGGSVEAYHSAMGGLGIRIQLPAWQGMEIT